MLIIVLTVLVLFVLTLVFVKPAKADVIPDALAVRAIIGESSDQGYKGMLAVACGIRNRGTLRGVYGVNANHVDKEPKWVWDLAKKAWSESENNRIHTGTHWENINAFGTPDWAKEMKMVYKYKEHVFYRKEK